jgi:hypothetical protein
MMRSMMLSAKIALYLDIFALPNLHLTLTLSHEGRIINSPLLFDPNLIHILFIMKVT